MFKQTLLVILAYSTTAAAASNCKVDIGPFSIVVPRDEIRRIDVLAESPEFGRVVNIWFGEEPGTSCTFESAKFPDIETQPDALKKLIHSWEAGVREQDSFEVLSSTLPADEGMQGLGPSAAYIGQAKISYSRSGEGAITSHWYRMATVLDMGRHSVADGSCVDFPPQGLDEQQILEVLKSVHVDPIEGLEACPE